MEKLISGLVTGLKGEPYVLEDRIGGGVPAKVLKMCFRGEGAAE